MVSRSPGTLSMNRKLRVLKSLTRPKSVSALRKRSNERGRQSVIMDTLDYIKALKLKVEMLSTAYINILTQVQLPPEVEVGKTEKGFAIRVTCPKGRDLLVRILEALEKMRLNVLQARVSSNSFFFCMEVISVEGEAGEKESLDAISVKQALLNALDSKKVQPAHLGPTHLPLNT